MLVAWDEERSAWHAWVPVDLRFICYSGSEAGTYDEGWGLDGIETREEGLDFTDVAYLDGFDRSELIRRLDRALHAREARAQALLDLPEGPWSAWTLPG